MYFVNLLKRASARVRSVQEAVMSQRIVWCFALVLGASPAVYVAASPIVNAAASADLDSEAASDIDDRFSTDGYAGVYFAALQSSVPALGLTGSIYLDDDLRAGIDFWRGSSKAVFSSFSSQGAGLWVSWELGDRFWMKGGLNYSRLDRPTAREPLAALFGSKTKVDTRPSRTDSIEANIVAGQLWTFKTFSVSTDYVGFSWPFMTLTGPKQSSLNLTLLKADFLYNIE
jgi:hypothetical protein